MQNHLKMSLTPQPLISTGDARAAEIVFKKAWRTAHSFSYEHVEYFKYSKTRLIKAV